MLVQVAIFKRQKSTTGERRTPTGGERRVHEPVNEEDARETDLTYASVDAEQEGKIVVEENTAYALLH